MSFIGLLTKWKVSPNTDEIMGNTGTATAVPNIPGAAPLIVSSHKLLSNGIIHWNIFSHVETFIVRL